MSTMRSASPPETAEPFANVPQTLRGRASTDPGRRPRTVARNRWSSDQPVRMTGIPLGSRLSLSPPRSPGHPSHAAAGLGEVDLFRRLSAHWDHKCAVERLTQLEQDEALARRLQEQVRGVRCTAAVVVAVAVAVAAAVVVASVPVQCG